MRLERIRLQNIRAFEDSGDVQLQDGTISIYGENGSGKSTIVSSIGRVVFGWDVEGVRQATINYGGERHKQGAAGYFLRRGATEGTIDVTFSHKGTVYRVVNTLSRKAQSWELYVDGEKTDLFGKEEIHERIYDALGVRERYANPIESVFSNLICILQGRIVDEFELPSQKRKDHFDRVLGLYTYRQAYSDSIHVKNNFKNKIARAESDARVIEAEIAHLDDLAKRLATYEHDAIQIERSIGATAAQLVAAEKEKQLYDSLHSEIESLKRDRDIVNLNANQLSEMQENAARDIKRARDAALIVKRTLPSFDRYNQLSDQIDTIRTLLREVGHEKGRLSDLQIKSAGLASIKKSKQDELRERDLNAKRAKKLAPVAVQYDELKATLDVLRIDEERHKAAQKNIAHLEELVESKQVTASRLDDELVEYDTLKSVARTVDALSREHEELAHQIGELSGHKRKMGTDLDDLLRGTCPYTSEPCQTIEARGHQYERELRAIDQKLKTLRTTYQERSRVLSEARDATNQLHVLDEKRQELERTRAEIERYHQKIRVEEELLEELCRRVAQTGTIEGQMNELKSDAEEYYSLKYALDKSERATLVQGLKDVEREETQLQQAISTSKERIAQLIDQGGDELLVTQLEKEQRELRSEYDDHIAAQELATQLDPSIARCEEHTRNLQKLEKQRLKLSADLESKARLYDENKHQQSERAYLDVSQKLNELRGIASQLEKHIGDLQPQAAALEVKKEDLMALDVELAEIAADGKFFDEIRESFKNLSEMRPRYIRKTSQHAARYWAQLANDRSQLHWQEDYLLFKTDGDDVISLFEMSGGEKISACLAMRLAMQEALGGLGLFILDEPTIHLDEERCDSLARQIGSITGLNQIIVISHDNAFHPYTQQQITIKKGADSHGSTVEC